MSPSSIQREIQQTKPFPSLEQEATVAILRTADFLKHGSNPLFDTQGITQQQYNVLRILRGAGRDGLPTLGIAERLIEHTPGITRLLDRLERKALVRRSRPDCDRRQVFCAITDSGLELLARLDAQVDEQSRLTFRSVSPEETLELLRILEKIRNPR